MYSLTRRLSRENPPPFDFASLVEHLLFLALYAPIWTPAVVVVPEAQFYHAETIATSPLALLDLRATIPFPIVAAHLRHLAQRLALLSLAVKHNLGAIYPIRLGLHHPVAVVAFYQIQR